MIPVLNEQASIGRVSARIPSGPFDAVIVADNGSTDRTIQAAADCGARDRGAAARL